LIISSTDSHFEMSIPDYGEPYRLIDIPEELNSNIIIVSIPLGHDVGSASEIWIFDIVSKQVLLTTLSYAPEVLADLDENGITELVIYQNLLNGNYLGDSVINYEKYF